MFGQLCRLERDCATKQIFLLRLCSSYNGYLDSGFISDVINLLRKYDLFYVLQDYVLHDSFRQSAFGKDILTSEYQVILLTNGMRELLLLN